MLNTMGIKLEVNPIQLLTRNTASVMVTATLPPFARPGTKLDVQVSSMANAKSLRGGTLLLTPLKAPNQEVFAVAQGPISTSGFEASEAGTSVVKNQQSGGIIPSGAIVEKAVDIKIEEWKSVFPCHSPSQISRRPFESPTLLTHIWGTRYRCPGQFGTNQSQYSSEIYRANRANDCRGGRTRCDR